MSDIRCLEHPTLKVPYENLNKRFRASQKTIERELAYLNSAATETERALNESEGMVRDIPMHFGNVLDKINNFETKMRDSLGQEVAAISCCKARIEHLRQGCKRPQQARETDLNDADSPYMPGALSTSQSTSLNHWKKTRVDRMLVDHFLRSGFYESAIKLARTSDIADLTNINIFLVAKDVEAALTRKDTSKILAWCHDNKSKMRKIKSSLEFQVRLQEFVELVKSGRTLDAVKHSRKYLSTAEPEQLCIVQTAMALLAFPTDTTIPMYQDLFRDSRWLDLIEQFRNENYRLFQLSNQSVFSVALQAGLSALKTQKCTSRPLSDRNNECPVCQCPLNELANPLPYAHCSQSRLICYISGKPLNEHNHPMMLPNGYVYGEDALMQMSMENDGQIVCPRTKDIFAITDVEKIFVM